jgi:hypothetical protein
MTDGGRATKTKTAPRKTATRAKTTTRAKSSTTTAQRRSQPARARTEEEHGVSVPVPVLTPHMKVMHLRTPGMAYVEDAGRMVAAYMPPPERIAFYGGLGLAAVMGVLDWPVAAAIGVGAVVARRAGMRRQRSGGSPAQVKSTGR